MHAFVLDLAFCSTLPYNNDGDYWVEMLKRFLASYIWSKF